MQTPETEARRRSTSLGEWYAVSLRPKLARAAGEGRVDPLQAIALERAMADLLAGDPEPRRRPREGVREAVSQ